MFILYQNPTKNLNQTKFPDFKKKGLGTEEEPHRLELHSQNEEAKLLTPSSIRLIQQIQ